jgi:hypothetical protein
MSGVRHGCQVFATDARSSPQIRGANAECKLTVGQLEHVAWKVQPARHVHKQTWWRRSVRIKYKDTVRCHVDSLRSVRQSLVHIMNVL